MDVKNVRLRLMSNFLIAYLLIAMIWWSVLLVTKNKDAFTAKKERMEIIMIAEGRVDAQNRLETMPEYQALYASYQKQAYMILGEAGVLTLTLLISIYLINNSYNKQVAAADQQRNFLLSITHELKSPLASIRLALETIQRRKLQPEQVQTVNAGALSETDRLTTLIEDILLSARLETNYQPNYELVELDVLAEQTIHKLQEKYPTTSILMQFEGDISPVYGDHTGWVSIFTNLIENGIKYSAHPASITVAIQEMGQQIRVQVKDKGIGISEANRQKVFSKFFRIGNEDTRRTKGTGLGLYIVEQIVKAHQGQISISANKPQGTVFSILIPIEKSKSWKEKWLAKV